MRRTRFVGALTLCAVVAVLALASPALAAVPVKPGAATASQFASAQQCRCHGPFVTEWQSSMHSKALSDPLFTTKVAEGDKATGNKLGPFCRRCHGPVANMTGEDKSASMSPASAESITCSFCHQITAVSRPVGNVSQLLEPGGIMRAQIEDPQSPHQPVYSALHKSSVLCGGCHNVMHPVNGMHLESTYAEWQRSPQAKQGLQCQDCHMSDTPPDLGPSTGTAANGAQTRPNIYHMTFAGAQVGLGDAARATALLKSAAKLEVTAPQIVAPGSSAKVGVKITNVGAGHYLPTGLTEVRQMWVELVAVDDSGKEKSLGTHMFGTVLKDAKGKHPVQLWDATGIYSDDRIPPKGSVTETFTVSLPGGVTAADLRARLLYKSAPDGFAKAAGVQNPVTTMAEAVSRVFATQQAMAADAAKPATTPAAAPAASGSAGSGSSNPALLVGGGVLALVVVLGGAAFALLRKKG